MITEEMTALVPCPLCGGSKGYTLAKPHCDYKRFEVQCSVCGEPVTDCLAGNRRFDDEPPSSSTKADAAWNEAGAYAEGLRVSVIALREICRDAHDRLLRGASERELLATLTVGYGPGPYGRDE